MRPVFFKNAPTFEGLFSSPRSGLRPPTDEFRFVPTFWVRGCFLVGLEPGVIVSGLAAGKRFNGGTRGRGVSFGRRGNSLEIPKPLSPPFRASLAFDLGTTWLRADSDVALSASSTAPVLTGPEAASRFGDG